MGLSHKLSRAYSRNRYKLHRIKAILRPHIKNLILFYLIISLLVFMVVVGIKYTEGFKQAKQGMIGSLSHGIDWLISISGVDLWQSYNQVAIHVVQSTLPSFVSDHEAAPKFNWPSIFRSWIYYFTDYDLFRPTSLFEKEFPGFAEIAREQREVIRAPVSDPAPYIVESQVEPQPEQIEYIDLPATEPEIDNTVEENPEISPIEPSLHQILTSVDWGKEPLVAILHTHPSEMYRTDTFGPASAIEYHLFGTTQTGVVRVGEVIAKTLWEKYGIPVIHDKTLHNTPSYSLAYLESRKTVRFLLDKYPSMTFIFDIHRDGVNSTSMVATIDDITVGQIAAVVGKPSQRDLGNHLLWQENLAFAEKFKELFDMRYPGVFRRILQQTGTYNQDLHTNYILLEVGNYYDMEEHALHAAVLLADVIAEMLYYKVFGESQSLLMN